MTRAGINPQAFERRSPVYRCLTGKDTEYVAVNGGAVVSSTGSPATEKEAATRLALCDLSLLPRMGFKGPGTVAWLTLQGVSLPPGVNTTARTNDGILISQLGMTEFLILSDLNYAGDPGHRLMNTGENNETAAAGTYRLPRQDSHCCFAVTGSFAAGMFAKLCAIDLRSHKFLNLSVAQTSVARVSSIIIRSDLAETACYLVLTDTTFAEYLWHCLVAAMAEYGGEVIGLNSLIRLKT